MGARAASAHAARGGAAVRDVRGASRPRDRSRAGARSGRATARVDPLREDWQRIALALYARYRGKNEALSQAEDFAGCCSVTRQRTGTRKRRIWSTHPRRRDRCGRHGARPPARQNDRRARRPGRLRAPRRAGSRHGGGALAVTRGGRHVRSDQQEWARRARPARWRRPRHRPPPRRRLALAVRPAGARTDVPKSIVRSRSFRSRGREGGRAQLIAEMVADDLISVLSRGPTCG